MSNLLRWFVIAVIAAACQSHPYEEMKQRELASGKRYDSLVMQMRFGMSLQDFFDQCMELNKQQLVTEGPGNRSVQFIITEDVKAEVKVLFRPAFQENKIYQVNYTYTYSGWAPWNRDLFSDQLLPEVKRLIERDFGAGFVKIEHPEKPSVFAKVDGNRRIVISREGDQNVIVQFTDLTAIEDTKNETF